MKISQLKSQNGSQDNNSQNISEKLSMIWNDYYNLAEKYYNRHGNLNTPSTCWYKGENIGAWLSRQRVCHLPDAPHPLDECQVELLDALHMDWKIRRRDWEVCFGFAERYYAEHGNLRMPSDTIVGGVNGLYGSEELEDLSEFNLYGWLLKQRRRYLLCNKTVYTDENLSKRKAVGKPLTEEQISRLESIGMTWTPHDDAWERAFAVAERYYKEHGDLSVPKHYEEDGINLSHWIWAQRRSMPGTESGGERQPTEERKPTGEWKLTEERQPTGERQLTEERIRRLESIGMEWAPKSKGFGYYYDQAKKFYEAYGHTDFPAGDVYVGDERLPESGEQLLAWKHEQEQYLLNADRNNQTRQTFAAHRRRLCEIGINPTNWEIPWEKNYRYAESWYREHGNLLVPYYYKTEDGIALGKWISEQRLKKKGTAKSKLSEQQISRLDKIGMTWDLEGRRSKRGAAQSKDKL